MGQGQTISKEQFYLKPTFFQKMNGSNQNLEEEVATEGEAAPVVTGNDLPEKLPDSSSSSTKFPWLNLSGLERFAITARLSQKRRFAAGSEGSLVLSQETKTNNDSEESVGDIPIELRHLEEDFCSLLPPIGGSGRLLRSTEPPIKV